MTAQLPILLGNEVGVEKYATEINEQLASSTNAWRKVAEIFAAAQDQFGRQSKEMKQLGKKTNFSVAKVDKLTLISNCKRLKNHDELFSRVQTWTVLYQVTLLDDDQFAALSERLRKGENLTTGLVTSIRKPKPDANRVNYQQFAEIKIDVNAFRLGRFQQDDYEQLIKNFEVLSEKIPYINVKINDLWTKSIKEEQNEISVEYDRVVRRAHKKEMKKHLIRLKPTCDKNYYKRRKVELKEETAPLLEGTDYEVAFKIIESDQFDPGEFHTEAQQTVKARREKKYGELLSEPFPDTETNFMIAD